MHDFSGILANALAPVLRLIISPEDDIHQVREEIRELPANDPWYHYWRVASWFLVLTVSGFTNIGLGILIGENQAPDVVAQVLVVGLAVMGGSLALNSLFALRIYIAQSKFSRLRPFHLFLKSQALEIIFAFCGAAFILAVDRA